MQLIRLDSNPNPKPDEFPDHHGQTEYGIDKVEDFPPESSTVKVAFPRFGRGEQKRSDFAVEVTWIDMQGFTEAFIEMGHPDALYLQRLIKLGAAIERAGWVPSNPPTVDFLEQFLLRLEK